MLRAQDESKRLAEKRDCQAHRIAELDGRMKGIAIHHNTLLKEEADKAKEAQLKWREEAAQRQALQQSVKDWEEQLAKTHLEYEDRVRWEQAKRIAVEAQLQAIPHTSMDSNPRSTPQGRGTQPNNQGSRSSRHSQRAPSNTVAGRLAQAAGAGSAAEGAVGPTSHRGHRYQRSQRKPESSRSQP